MRLYAKMRINEAPTGIEIQLKNGSTYRIYWDELERDTENNLRAKGITFVDCSGKEKYGNGHLNEFKEIMTKVVSVEFDSENGIREDSNVDITYLYFEDNKEEFRLVG